MSGISGIGGYSPASNYYQALSSGSRINSAKDGASELAIAEKQDSQINGYNAGSENLDAGKSLANIADGALGGISDSLQRMRELAVKASNGLLSNDDKKAIQSEIDQLKQGISDVTSSTNYNGIKLLDGSSGNINLVSDGNGTEQSVSGVNTTLEALGIADFNVTGKFDIRDLDKAIDTVNSARSGVGANTNGIDYSLYYNSSTSQNLSAANSRTKDTEYEEYVSKLQKQETLDTYKLMMQKKQMENDVASGQRLFMSI
ncbi:MAG: flagellin FliC5 [Lachnospiraceae bacterium]|nr:flagellin FliC5 [Lachnospiraceae bacterium]